jgi:hypothetical protein
LCKQLKITNFENKNILGFVRFNFLRSMNLNPRLKMGITLNLGLNLAQKLILNLGLNPGPKPEP